MKPLGKAELHLQRARKALRENRLPDAQRASEEALRRVPDCADAYVILGEVAWAQQALDQAVGLFEAAHRLDPQNSLPLTWLARALARTHRLGPALAAAKAAADLNPRDAASLHALGLVFARALDHARARELFQKAVGLSPRNTTYLADLGVSHQVCGSAEEAEGVFERCIQIDPAFFRAYAKLVELRPQTTDQNYGPVLEGLLRRSGDDVDRALTIGYALAKSYEDLGDPAASLDSLRRGKETRRRRVHYSYARDEALFAAAMDTLSDPPAPRASVQSDRPIFVVGMPRSGTTLTDRILSSHPQIASVGELQTVALLTHELAGAAAPRQLQAEAIRRAASMDLAPLGASYLREVAAVTGDDRYCVDKHPFNFLFAGLIHKALPNARIICLRRDPIDVCLSNYRTFFSPTSAFHDYAYDLCDIARYYILFDRLMARCSATLPPDRFMSIRYESLVEDQEIVTRRLLAFCGVDWDDRCMDFQDNVFGVVTPSIQQVRRRLFTTSIGRWRNYGDALKPMIEILDQAGVLATQDER